MNHKEMPTEEKQEHLQWLAGLSGSEFTSAMLKVFRMRAEDVANGDLLRRFSATRFTAPADLDPAAYHRLQAILLEKARSCGFIPLLLSPLAPFGSCSAFGCVNQDKVMSTIRGAEALADPTNMLAVHIASNIRSGKLEQGRTHHFCATAQVTRAQNSARKGVLTHFGLLGFVSSGMDTGSYLCEKELLLQHLRYYEALLEGSGQVVLHRRSGYPDEEGFWNRMTDFLQNAGLSMHICIGEPQEENSYYRGLNFKIYGEIDGVRREIADGGFVDWINRMTGLRKLRCLISGAGLERLLSFVPI